MRVFSSTKRNKKPQQHASNEKIQIQVFRLGRIHLILLRILLHECEMERLEALHDTIELGLGGQDRRAKVVRAGRLAKTRARDNDNASGGEALEAVPGREDRSEKKRERILEIQT